MSDLPIAAKDFLEYMETIRGKSKKTIQGYSYDLTLFFKYMKIKRNIVPEDMDFEEIVISDIDGYFMRTIGLSDLYSFISYAANERNNLNYARARKVACLRSFFKFLHTKAKIIDDNPALELEPPKINSRQPVYLSLEESKILLKAVEGPYKERDYAILMLFLNCGLRLSELVGIDLDKISGDTLRVIGKGNKERTVYLNDACIKALEAYMKIRIAEEVKEKDKKALFISRFKSRISPRTIQEIVKKYIRNAGLDDNKYSPHKLRHTAATLMYKYGNVDIRALQQILGHESVATTQIYTHIDDDRLRQAARSNPLSEEHQETE
ncbi:tyrosine recombinase XerC [Lutispora saccharofermentans]|uniref:Tyrosine recombinase XerC n=1 Tax=Lutispora saccharofermentans TaxID=3024236 RepID=A0ABT1NJ37_9FIRM|nr:tyrosine recombinase XerC [Lutispora saccharofermentans]MCQ1529891.1 tyrosine recombinase XerC [Lutispora saccharofermentans]